jgi:hypothetical protein
MSSSLFAAALYRLFHILGHCFDDKFPKWNLLRSGADFRFVVKVFGKVSDVD